MAARDSSIDIANLAVGHQLGLFERALDRVDRGFDIDHHAFFKAARWVPAHADHFKGGIRSDFSHDGGDF
jgi:hypothetical protein